MDRASSSSGPSCSPAACGAAVVAGDRATTTDDPPGRPRASPTAPSAASPTREPSRPPSRRPAGARRSSTTSSSTGSRAARNQCATLEVPLDYADPTGETIELALLRVPRRRPGRAGRARSWSTPAAPARPAPTTPRRTPTSASATPLREHFDIVGFDPRGTGERPGRLPHRRASSTPTRATPTRQPRPRCAAYVDGLRRASARAAWQKSGDLAGHVSTIEAARDMDVLRAALGEDEADLLRGVLRHPPGRDVRRAVPDERRPARARRRHRPALPTREGSLEQAGGLRDRAAGLRRRTASTGRLLPRRHRRRGPATGSPSSSTEIDAEPLPTDDERELDRSATPFYGHRRCRSTSRTTGPARPGPPGRRSTATATTLLLLVGPLRLAGADGSYSDNSLEAIYAINCLDDPTRSRPTEVPDHFAEFEKASPTFGRVFAWGLVSCRGIPVQTDRAADRDRRLRARPRSWSSARRATRPRRTSGRWRWPTSSSPGSWSAATATATPATTGQRLRRRRGRGLPDRRHRAARRH